MNIKVAAFTVSEKSINILFHMLLPFSESPLNERTDTAASADTWHEQTVCRTHFQGYPGMYIALHNDNTLSGR